MTRSTADEQAVVWLLARDEPSIRYLTRRDVLGEEPVVDVGEMLADPLMSGLLRGQQDDGSFGVDPYRKWTGGFWRIASLAELAAPAESPQVQAAVNHVLDWLLSTRRHTRDRVVDGLTRTCASMEGLALASACRLGFAADPRAEKLARGLVSWQWPDGGWNCDVRASGRRSSFHETHGPIDGLGEYAAATGATWAAESAARAMELVLGHHVFRPMRPSSPDAVMHKDMLRLRYPAYWHYGVLRALVLLARGGRATDPRAAAALDYLDGRRAPDGLWGTDGSWWHRVGSQGSNTDVVDWGRGDSNMMVTLQALTVRRAAGRLAPQVAGRDAVRQGEASG